MYVQQKRRDQIYSTKEKSIEVECKKRKRKITNSLEEVVNIFHTKKISIGAVFMCRICDQLFYRHSVDSNYKPCKEGKAAELFRIYSKASFDGNVIYTCKTCVKYLKKDSVPPCSVANGFQFPKIPNELSDLQQLEWTLLSPRIAFIKIHAAPGGNQKIVKGNVFNVPADISSMVEHLPLVPNENYTIQVELNDKLPKCLILSIF